MKVVIIDDNKTAAKDLQEKLGKFPYVEIAGIASNGFNGLEVVLNTKPDVLFLDVELPDISGLDFLERSSYLHTSDCRVIIYTSYDKYVLPAFRRQAFDVLLKPIEPKELDNIMERLEKTEEEEPSDSERPTTMNSNKYLLYTNNVDFTLVDKSDIGLFRYDSESRCWEAIVAGFKHPIRLRRTIKSESLIGLDNLFVQVNQKFIINMNYLVEVSDNVCHFFPPFDKIEDVTVGRIYRKKLKDSFFNL